MRQALGLIETVGLAAAIEAADTAVKAADVTLLGYEMTRGNGMITIKLVGDVGAINAAVTAGVMAANRVNEVYSYHVIPRPHDEIEPLITQVDRGSGRGGLVEPVPLGSDGGDGGSAPASEPPAPAETSDSAPAPLEKSPALFAPVETQPEVELEAEETEPEPQSCAAITQAGTRCRNRAQPGSRFCHIHAPSSKPVSLAETVDEEE